MRLRKWYLWKQFGSFQCFKTELRSCWLDLASWLYIPRPRSKRWHQPLMPKTLHFGNKLFWRAIPPSALWVRPGEETEILARILAMPFIVEYCNRNLKASPKTWRKGTSAEDRGMTLKEDCSCYQDKPQQPRLVEPKPRKYHKKTSHKSPFLFQ